MASVPDVAPFLRRSRLGSAVKVRPVMKLEWNKLLAEATEKDTENKTQSVDQEAYYDDEVYELEDYETSDKINNVENDGDTPLNLCYKSHTMPSIGNQIQNATDVLDLSAGKQPVQNNVNKTPMSSSKQSCTFPNIQFNQMPSSDDKNIKKRMIEPIIENKENVFGSTNKNNKFSTPYKTGYPEKNEKHLEEIDKSKNNLKQNQISLKQNLIFFSERKPPPPSSVEKVKSTREEINSKSKSEVKKERIVPEEKKNNSLAVQSSNQLQTSQKVQQNPQAKPQEIAPSEKFAVPAVPLKHKESSKTLIINKKPYQILAPLGKGGSSKVYLVLNAENELLAVKCVKLSDVSESTKNDYLNEIQHLLKMQHSKHVIRLYDHQYLSSQKLLLAVMERGETDLSRFLKDKASSDEGISPELIMYYWTEMLMAVKSIHDNNIIHRDLKPANFLLVSGRLKLIDFGIASAIQTEQTSVLMESQSGTFNYMSPEALQDLGFDNKIVLKIGRKTDVWSLGCILYYFLYKKTPYQDLVKPLQKLKAIIDPNHQVPFPKIPGVPDILIESCKRCLVHDTKKRASIEELLAFRNRPLLSLSQVLGKLQSALTPEEYEKAAKAFKDADVF